jgi:hypothetical protein
MTDAIPTAENTNRPFFFTPTVANVIAFCRASNFWDAPTAELDMFSRWIRLSDRVLAADQKARKQSARHGRRKCIAISFAKPVWREFSDHSQPQERTRELHNFVPARELFVAEGLGRSFDLWLVFLKAVAHHDLFNRSNRAGKPVYAWISHQEFILTYKFHRDAKEKPEWRLRKFTARENSTVVMQ